MIEFFMNLLLFLTIYVLFDYLLPDSVMGKYYLIHSLNNAYVVYLTLSDVMYSYYDLLNFTDYQPNYEAAAITFALHFYHIISYFDKLRYDDWLHHILMVVVCLPLSISVKGGCLLGHSLFFTTGLPGCIDYFMLFLVRNNFMRRITEKKINNYINLWLRAPGCTAQSILTCIVLFDKNSKFNFKEKMIAFITAGLVFWNGIYFMNQVVVNYSEVRNKMNNKNIRELRELRELKNKKYIKKN